MEQDEKLKQKLKKVIDECNNEDDLELLKKLLTDIFPATVKLAKTKQSREKKLDK